MGSDECCAAAFKQMIEDRTCQGCTLLRISARAKFIEDDQRMGIDLLENADDVRDVTAKRAERLFNGLLIANIGVDRMEAGQLRTALHGDVESALRHEHKQTDRFERNCFPAGVGTCDDDGARAGLGIDIDRNDSSLIEERVTSTDQVNEPLAFSFGLLVFVFR